MNLHHTINKISIGKVNSMFINFRLKQLKITATILFIVHAESLKHNIYISVAKDSLAKFTICVNPKQLCCHCILRLPLPTLNLTTSLHSK